MKLLALAFLDVVCFGEGSVSLPIKTSTRGTLLPPPTMTSARKITTTVDIETPSIEVIVSEGGEEQQQKQGEEALTTAKPKESPTTTDWSTVLPTRWYPRRKQASAAESLQGKTFLIPGLMVIGLSLLLFI